MNNIPRQKLCEIITRFGRSVIDEPRRCEGLLRDYCGAYRREIAVLLSALEERVATDLLTANAVLPRAVLFARLAQRLHDNVAMDDQAASWAVGSWALALGVISHSELTAIERAGVDTKAPATPPAAESPASTSSVPSTPRASTAAAPPITQTNSPQKKKQQPPSSSSNISSASALSSTIVVSAEGNGDYTSISEGLRNAARGARVLVRPGLYRESIVIDKPVEMIGDGAQPEIIIESTQASCIVARTADQATVRGLTLREIAGISNAGNGFFAVDILQGQLTLEYCDITSNSLSCIGIHNNLTSPVIRRCRIHASADSGIYIFNRAAGTIENCDIYDNTNVGIAITERATPVIKQCAIRDGRNAGVVAWNSGFGLIEECDIFGNAKAGIGISQDGDPVIRRCRIYGGENSGVFVHDNGQGTLEDCDIYSHREAEVAVTLGGNATLRGCKIHESRLSGVFIRDEGRALIENCDVYSNADAGVSIHSRGIGVIRQCRINGNGTIAIRVEAGSAVDVENSDLTLNQIAAFETDYGALVESRGNRL